MKTRQLPTDVDIIRAARAVFLARGIAATTAEIAACAGVAKGTLHERFSSKDDLFRAALAAEPPPWTRQLEGAIGVGDVRDNLAGLFVEMVRWSERVAPLGVLGLSVPSTERTVDVATMRGERELARYLEEEMALGRLRYADPEQWARLLAVAAWDFALVGGVETPALSVWTMWRGLEPRDDEIELPSSDGPRPTWPPGPAPMPLAAPAPHATRGSTEGAPASTGAPSAQRAPASTGAPPSAERAPAATGAAADLERTQRSARLVRADGRPVLTMLGRAARCFRRRGGRRPRRRMR